MVAGFRTISTLCLLANLIAGSLSVQAQTEAAALQDAGLKGIIEYALKHQPAVRQAVLDEQITDRQVSVQLSNWYPQINFGYTGQHFADLQSNIVGGNVIKLGLKNTSSLQLSFNQAILNRDVLFASATAEQVRRQSRQSTDRVKSDLITRVTKGFYDVLITMQQIRVSEEAIQRLQRSLNDAKSRYQSGVSDKTDFKRAGILLANAEVTLRTNREALKNKQTLLKTLIGYPSGMELSLQINPAQMEVDAMIDTLAEIDFENQIDYRILRTQRELQEASVKYSRLAFLPTISAFGAYSLNYQSNDLSELYSTRYPFSHLGLTVSIPVFQGGKRIAKIREEKLRLGRIDIGLSNLKETLQAEYVGALAAYKSNLTNFRTQKENAETAREVYDVIQLQYVNGVRNYLDVTVAETELNTTRINYYNALYQLLASEADVRRVSGQISY